MPEPWADTPIIGAVEVYCVKCRRPPAEYTGYRTRLFWHGLAQCHGEQAQFTITREQNEKRGGKKIELFGGIVLPAKETPPPCRLLLMDRKLMNKTQTAELLAANAYAVYRATCVGGACEFVRNLFEEIYHPKVGDLVLEITTFRLPGRDVTQNLGRLIAIVNEPYFATKEDAYAAGYEPGEELPTIRRWVLKLEFDDGREFRWENAAFIKVLEQVP